MKFINFDNNTLFLLIFIIFFKDIMLLFNNALEVLFL